MLVDIKKAPELTHTSDGQIYLFRYNNKKMFLFLKKHTSLATSLNPNILNRGCTTMHRRGV